MAGILEEFDDAAPLKGTFCSRMSIKEYEEQASSCTQQALQELIGHLDENPEEFKVILNKRKHDISEDGIWSFVKVQGHLSMCGARM